MDIPNTGDQYNLKWNNHLANFVQTFIEHQHGESLVDVTLFCEGQCIKTHKLILSACSEYFNNIFQIHGTLQHPIIFLNGVKFKDLKYILHFMYHGEVRVVDKDLPDVLALGENLQIKGLSSVKLRDMPPEPKDNAPNPQKPAKKSSKKELNKPEIAPSFLRKVSAVGVPQYTLLNDRAPFDYSKRKSPPPLRQRNPLPIISSVSSMRTEVTLSQPIVISENTPVNGLANPQQPPPSASTNESQEVKAPVPKPPHAFMIFANEWRKKLTVEHPEENNKEISVRLGTMWKNLLPETKNIYYREAKRAEEMHKLKYPDYVSTSDSVKRKADVLSDSANTNLPATSVDPMEVVEIQEEIFVNDSD